MLKSRQEKIQMMSDRLSEAAAVRQLRTSPGWDVVAELIRRGIENRKSRMLHDECGIDEIKVHREVIRWAESLLRTPEITDEQMENWRGEIAFLVERERMIQSFDPPLQGVSHEVQ